MAMMEWASQWHGPEGKVHADKRTVEYTGRGNHSADAVSFVGAVSVGQAHTERTHRDARTRVLRAPCLATPLDGAVHKSDRNDAVGSGDAFAHASPASSSVDADDAETLRSDAGKKNKHRGNGKASASARKKRRVGYGTKNKEDEGDGDDDAQDVLRLPVYYFEVQVLATKYFQGDPRGRPHASDRAHDGDQVDDDANGEDDAEMKEDDDESDEVAMEAMDHTAVGDGDAPWRGRARRLIHEHLRAMSPGVVSDGAVAEALAAAVSSDTAIRHNGNGLDSASETASTANGNGDAVGVLRRSLSHHINGNGSSAATSASRLVRSTSSNIASPPSPPPLTHQQLLLSFPLSSSTIQQIRLRLERQHQQTQTHRRRSSSMSGTTADSGSTSLMATISNIHARHRRDTVRRKRSNHRIAVGFMFSKHGGEYKRDICHDELGRQACGIALVGKTGEVISNGQIFLQTDVRFGHGDTIGCGVILDTRTFFWTVNGRLAATLPVNDVHHLDDFEDHSVGADETAWFTTWADQLLPSVSLHEHGESVRALFAETHTERFRFNLGAFKQEHLKHRQTTLMAYTGIKAPNAPRDEEEIMHQLIEDYFVHFGYGNALSALHNLHRGTQPHSTHSRANESVALRHTVRQSIYSFNTQEALRHIDSQVAELSAHDATILLDCHILCVVDVLYAAHTSKRKGSNADAIRTAQEILHEYLSDADVHAEGLEKIRAFMSVLLYPSVDEIPEDCPGRRFLIWPFREEVADALNDALSNLSSEPCALEKLVDDLSELQRECLSCGASPFPLDENSLRGSRFPRGHKRDQDAKRRLSLRSEEDSDDENDDDSHSSSSGESDDDDDDDDDE